MQRLAQRKQKIANSRSMSLTMGQPMFRGGKNESDQVSFLSGDNRFFLGDAADRMCYSLSRVIVQANGQKILIDEKEIIEIIELVDEINEIEELQQKCEIL